jgi:hypothetical protein
MLGLVKLFLLEEIRLRRSFSTSLSLLVFPEIILVSALAGYIFSPEITGSITYEQIHLGSLSGLTLFGISMGGIAFLGKDFLERSLGPINMLAASSYYHPISDRRMFFAYYLHDLLFYIFLVLAPLSLGLAFGAIIRPMPVDRFFLITAAQWSSFLLGLSLSMLVSSILSGGSRWKLVLIPSSLLPLFSIQLITDDLSGFIPTVLAVNEGSWLWLGITLVLIAVYSLGGVLLYEGGITTYKSEASGSYISTRKSISRFDRDPIKSSLLAREIMNLMRGKAYIRIGFSLFFPLLVMLGLVGIISGFDQGSLDFNMPFFAVMVSFFTMSIYTNLVNMDFLDFDQTIPIRTSDLIRVKLKLYLLIAIPLSIVFLILVSLATGDLIGLIFALPPVMVMVPYMGYVTAYLTGLWTNSMLFDASVFLRYLILTVLPLMMATLLSFLMESILVISIIGLGLITIAGSVSTLFLSRSLEKKWSDAVLQSAGNG